MTTNMPDQRSTTDQLEDVASWATGQGLTEVTSWVLGKTDQKPSEENYQRALTWATRQRMYDAADWLKYRFTGSWA